MTKKRPTTANSENDTWNHKTSRQPRDHHELVAVSVESGLCFRLGKDFFRDKEVTESGGGRCLPREGKKKTSLENSGKRPKEEGTIVCEVGVVDILPRGIVCWWVIETGWREVFLV